MPGRLARTDDALAFLEGVMTVFAVLWTACMGMMAMSVWRFGLSRAFDSMVAARLDFKTDPKLGLVGWLTLPNSIDVLPALLFVACFAPPVIRHSRATAPVVEERAVVGPARDWTYRVFADGAGHTGLVFAVRPAKMLAFGKKPHSQTRYRFNDL